MYLRRISYWIAVLAICVGLAGCAGRHDIMLADFEGVDFGDWEVTGECFGTGPLWSFSAITGCFLCPRA